MNAINKLSNTIPYSAIKKQFKLNRSKPLNQELQNSQFNVLFYIITTK